MLCHISLIFLVCAWSSTATNVVEHEESSPALVDDDGGQGKHLDVSLHNLLGSKQGRHFLLISLLEELHEPYWFPRADGRLLLFLPPSLAPAYQPSPPPGGQILGDIVGDDGEEVVTREQVITLLNDRDNFIFLPGFTFSRFNQQHRHVVQSIEDLLTSQDTFASMLSMLVTIKEFLPVEVFVDIIYSLIQRRKDVGFIIPSVLSVQPEDFFTGPVLESVLGNTSGIGRSRRQAVTWATGSMASLNYRYKTLPDSEPESKMWYFREDPLINANHFHWHKVLSNDDAFKGSYMHSSNMDRRGEMFYFMHRQLLCRANLERLSVGLEVAKPYGPEEWGQPLKPGYDPMLGVGSSKKYAARPSGAVMFGSDQRKLKKLADAILDHLSYGYLHVKEWTRMEYVDGVDRGISILGDVIESYIRSQYGDLHNTGHTIIADLHKGMGEGIMATPNVALRDPVFSRWHKYVDDIFLSYKNSLVPYTDKDLNFPGVELTDVTVKTEAGDNNTLATFMDHDAFVQLGSLDMTKAGRSSVGVSYTRLDNLPFTFNLEIKASNYIKGMVRIFILPAVIPAGLQVNVTQLAVELDRFHVNLIAGINNIARKSTDSSFLAKRQLSLYELQKKLLAGEISENEFNWGGCGWPKEMLIPRGNETGMKFDMFVVLSPLLENDKAHTADWTKHHTGTWAWCGVRSDEGGMPDTRPMGFPLDRSPPNGDWKSLLVDDSGAKRGNLARLPVTIKHTP